MIDFKIYKGVFVQDTITEIEPIIQNGHGTPEGLAIDWIAENIYWVESNIDQIQVAKLNGSNQKTLISHDVHSPRAIGKCLKTVYFF